MPNIAGSYLTPFSLIGSPEYQGLSDADKQFARDVYLRQQGSINPAENKLIDWAIQQNTPEARQKILEQQLAFDKARGEQQQKYRMTNDIIANIGSAARSAFGGGRLPYDYLGQAVGNIGNAYLAGLQTQPSAAPQVGKRYF